MSEVVKREVECAKETLELGEGLAKFVSSLQGALADGWQSGQDLPVLLSAALTDLVPAVQGVEKIKDEVKDPQSFSNGIYVGVSSIPFLFIKKPE